MARVILYSVDDPCIIETRNSIIMKEFLESLNINFDYVLGENFNKPVITVDNGRYFFYYDNIKENPDCVKTEILDVLNPNSENWVV